MIRMGTSIAAGAALLLLPAGVAQASQAGFDVLSGSVSAADITPTEVTSLAAERSGSAVHVTGAATFGGQEPMLVAEDPTGNDAALGPLGPQLGLDISQLFIHQPDPNVPELKFIIRVTQLDRQPPPEVIRYLWQLDDVNGEVYWLQAKTSDVASTGLADDPEGTVARTSGSFRLRGACEDTDLTVTKLSGCSHVAWLTGAFDTAANEITVTVPIGSSDAPEFTSGATLFGHVQASFQAGFSNGFTSDDAGFEDDYIIPSKQVQLGIAPAGTNPLFVDFATTATVADDDSFLGDIGLDGLAPGNYEVFAKACFADNCGVRSVPVTIS